MIIIMIVLANNNKSFRSCAYHCPRRAGLHKNNP